MEPQSRIPSLIEASFDGALIWFSEMRCANLLFHPEDDPDTIFHIITGEKFFSSDEVIEVQTIIDTLEEYLGHEQLIEACYPVFMNAAGQKLDA